MAVAEREESEPRCAQFVLTIRALPTSTSQAPPTHTLVMSVRKRFPGALSWIGLNDLKFSGTGMRTPMCAHVEQVSRYLAASALIPGTAQEVI